MGIQVNTSLAHIEKQIEFCRAEITRNQQALQFWTQAKAVLGNPLFSEIPIAMPPPDESSLLDGLSSENEGNADDKTRSGYGLLKQKTFELLPDSSSVGLSPQTLADMIAQSGYEFRTKTPSISVNEALQTLKSTGNAKIVGKNASGANLWAKEADLKF